MSPDERGLVSSHVGDRHFNSRPTSAQTDPSLEVKLVSALVIGLPVWKVQAQVVYPSTLRCFLFQTFLLSVEEQSDLNQPRSINMNFKDFYFF